MFLKRQKRRKGGEDYSYWELARTVRTAAGPRHETVAYLGKLDEGEARREYGWPDIDALLEGREAEAPRQPALPGLGAAPAPEWRRVNVRGVRVGGCASSAGSGRRWPCGGGSGCTGCWPA